MILIFIALVSSQKLGGPMIPFFFFEQKVGARLLDLELHRKVALSA